MKHDEIVQKGTRHVFEVQNINRKLIEKALEMRALAYIANVKADLLTQTIFEMGSSKKALWRESEKRFQVLAQTATDAIIVVGTDKIIRFFNKAAEQIYGYSAYDVIGKNVQVLIPQKYWRGYELEFKRYLRTGRAQIIGKTIELTGLRKDGTMFPVELSLSESQIAGEITLNAIIRDITTCKKLEEDLKESEKRYRTLYNNLPIGVFRLTPEGKFLSVNPALVKLLGYGSEDEVLKIPATDFYVITERREELIERLHTEGSVKNFEIQIGRKNNSVMLVSTSIHSTFDEKGKLIYFDGTIEDITDQKLAALRLLESEENMTKAQQIAHIGSWELDVASNEIRCSEEMYRIHGLEKDSALSMDKIRKLIPPDDRDAFDKELAYLYDGKVEFIEYRAIKTDGEEMYARCKGEMFYDNSGKPVRIVGTVQDISERKRMENALRESEERYRAVFEQAADSVVIIDVDTGDILEFNDRAHDNLGYTREEFKKLRIADFEVIESEEEVKNHIKKVIKEGSDTFETKHRTKNGVIRDVLISTRTLSISGRNLISGLWQDITERKRAEEALRESKKRYQALAEVSPVGIFHTDAAGNCLYVNEQWCMIAGMAAEEAQAEGWAQALHPEDRERVFKEWYLASENGLPFQSEYRFRTPEGVTKWVFGQARTDLDENDVIVGHVGTITDITERKRMEEELLRSHDELEQRVQERTEELIKANEKLQAEMVQRKKTEKHLLEKSLDLHAKNTELNKLAIALARFEEKERKRLAEILHEGIGQNLVAIKIAFESGENLSEIVPLINETIKAARTVTTNLYPPVFDRMGFVKGLEWYSNSISTAKKIKVSLDIDEIEEYMTEELKGDFFRIIRECFQNTIKYASASRIDVKLKKNKGSLQLNVKDNGIGFNSKERDITMKSGSGIGFMLMREWVKSLDGNLKIASQPGKGTEIIVKLPKTVHSVKKKIEK